MAGACLESGIGACSEQDKIAGIPWFALRIREKLRIRTEECLDAQSIKYFSPMISTVRHWSDRKKTLFIPLFAGYLFCRFNPESLLQIIRTPGVIDIVRAGSELAQVNPNELDAIRRASVCASPVEAIPHLVCGQKVQVIAGPLAGIVGNLIDIRSQWKLVLAVTMMNRSVAVQIERSQIVAF